MITKYREMCMCCGKRKEEVHHLLFGKDRQNADDDGLTMPLCEKCHKGAIKQHDRIHGNPRAEDLSKMLGEAMFIATYNRSDQEVERIKDIFMKRYGRNYL